MRSKRFVDAYPETVQPFVGASPEIRNALQPAADWSLHFGVELHALLAGETPTTERATKLVQGYTRALNALMHSLQTAETLDTVVETDENWRVLQSLGFHSLAAASLGIWHSVLSGNTHIHRDVVHEAQMQVAVRTVHEMKERTDAVNTVGYSAYIAGEEGRRTDGEMTEADTYVAALGITKKYPHIAILPAPLQFESSNSHQKNMDLIALDLREDHAYGIQVKTQATDGGTARYDPRYVMVVDGRIDLDNVKTARRVPNKSMEIQASWPGLISAHFLQESPRTTTKKRASNLFAHDKVTAIQVLQRSNQARYLAGQLVGQTKSRTHDATMRIEDRLLYHLYI